MAVLAPASSCPADELEAGCSILEALGLKVVLNLPGNGSYPRYLAGSDLERAARFNESLEDAAIKALFCARGGYGSLRILPRLAYDRFRYSPKAVIGFSDLTSLLFACHWHGGLISFHGPTVSTLARSDEASVQSLWAALAGDSPMELHFPEALCLRPGKAVGAVLGGNLTTICHLVGTRFLPPLSGRILFIEDRGESLYRIDRMLTQLLLSNSLAGVAALLLGDFTQSGSRKKLNQLVLERLESTAFPVVSGIPVGHGGSNRTLPLGLTATLDADACTLTYHLAATMP